MKKQIVVMVVLAAFLIGTASAVPPKKPLPPKARVNTPWEARADKNKDGVVDRKEAAKTKPTSQERRWWRGKRSKVTNPVEKKYDANGNGWLEREEVNAMLKDKHTLIKTKGKAKVDTEIEKAYDGNNDGVIDAKEAEMMTEDIQ